LFFLDPFALEQARTFAGGEKAIYLADPIRMPPVSAEQVSQLAAELGIDPQRQVFLLFGHLDKRKGMQQMLAALPYLSADQCQRLCLLLVGPLSSTYQAQLDAEIETVCAIQPVQIIRRYGYAPQSEAPVYFHLADVVLTAYPQHFGMSGVQLLAAAAGKPILSSRHGLMGELARRYGLGLNVDAADSQAIAGAIGRFLEEDPASLYDPALMRRLAEEHDGRLFGRTIVEGLGITVKI
jgi:glycosyltransferase involved in cell wall biosynthesis